MRRIGVLGSMVWDRIHARDGRAEPVEEWGGIAYALAGMAAAAPPGWEIVPLLKVGRDLEAQARAFLAGVPRLDPGPGIRIVAEPNNRVELRYLDSERRTECLTGGVPGWTMEELVPVLAGLDALYVNFIAGWELELATASHLRLAFPGPLYADLHSLFLGVGPGGERVPRPLPRWSEWLRSFDLVQVNEEELGYLAAQWGDPWRFAAEVVGPELRALLVTLGGRGAAYVASPAFRPRPLTWRTGGLELERPLATPGAVLSERVGTSGPPRAGDPTGCGDVWGATCFARLLAGEGLVEAMEAANRAAARNVEHRGATGLVAHLQGRIHT